MTAEHFTSFVDYMMGRHPGRHAPMSNNNEFSYPGQPYEYDDPKPMSRKTVYVKMKPGCELEPLTEEQKTMIADAVEEMRPQIEAAKPAGPLSTTSGAVGEGDRREAYLAHLKMEYERHFGPAREQDYMLSASNMQLVTRGLLLVMGDKKTSKSEFGEAHELRDKFRRGFETVIRDVQS